MSIGPTIRRVRVFLKSGLSKNKRQKLNINNNWGARANKYGETQKMPDYMSVAM